MFPKKLPNKKTLILLLLLVLSLIGYLITSHLPSPTITSPITPTVTTTPSEFTVDTNPVENSPEWNESFESEIQRYEKSRNNEADTALSQIRLNSPINVSGNTVSYNYKTATYTITLVSPYLANQKAVLNWFDKQGINATIFKDLRVNWIQK